MDGLSTIVVGGGGSLLGLFGYKLVRNQGPFENGWNENGEQGRLALLILRLTTASLVVAAELLLVDRAGGGSTLPVITTTTV